MKLILFDFDGVLIDTFIISLKISREVNKKMSLNLFRSIFNGNIYDSLKNNTKVKQHPEFFKLYEKQSRKLEIPKKLKDLICKLSKNYTLAIISATPSTLIATILKQANVFKYFSDILGGDIHTSKVVKNKMLLEKYKIEPKDAVFITDTTGDILEARECGIESIAVTWGFHEKETLQKEKPFKIVSTPEDLEKAIEEIL
ncbi:hypothetical protein A3B85_03230 [Candidatus Nomurabacteria bacterium RIFCSPHIGHO2_02_FULL_37_13]|uniref:FCP1 homology domain-containing protein n=1 Tax=Candidatus Nomurabacteria bacterium RIFCSPHIGHO2_02_FULL_37_13 TaxID=1801750 RepID=A0A1F6W732_9BACT|nr:MAG: hypothetical protein A2640_00925 [Candidatus Nomurabacteria bacterium RIFCSPHIGHO2_01_FULL_36_23]OGI77747.1 MAG: hypothetical protein A3B85_03230 [Candidatus Nomurabacteria bacterium RIFCSPHIGHO2_02_FULL_37_13]OGI87702.1 MAG: hypothetical protein A2906_00380 [Candidatus Nomurabacteria bacterium RIFCSPLOWO2_01_FULL_37_25]